MTKSHHGTPSESQVNPSDTIARIVGEDFFLGTMPTLCFEAVQADSMSFAKPDERWLSGCLCACRGPSNIPDQITRRIESTLEIHVIPSPSVSFISIDCRTNLDLTIVDAATYSLLRVGLRDFVIPQCGEIEDIARIEFYSNRFGQMGELSCVFAWLVRIPQSTRYFSARFIGGNVQRTVKSCGA